MKWEQQLRRFGVAERLGIFLILVLSPLVMLTVISVAVLNEQEMTFRDSVEESITMLLPLSTLEHYLQRALVDELEAQSGQASPNFAALADSVDKAFSDIDLVGKARAPEVVEAERAWASARPSVRRLTEQVRPLSLGRGGNAAADARARADLQVAMDEIAQAQRQLTAVVRARYAHAIAQRHRQLRWLVVGWTTTLLGAAVMVVLLLRSLLRPIHDLGRAARKMGEGVPGVRAQVTGNDELTLLAERFNQMAAYWEASHQSLLTEAAQDPLTGALNRRGILTALETDLATHAREQAPISVFMIDLDRFKAINDQFGHSAGDRALVWVVTRLRAMLREGDRLGRYGGDEFLAVLPRTTLAQAQEIAGRIETSLNEAAARESARPGASIGIGAAPEHGWAAAALIEAADSMLYSRKGQRRTDRDADWRSTLTSD